MDNTRDVEKEFMDGNSFADEITDFHEYIFMIRYTEILSLQDDSIKRKIADLCVKEVIQKLQTLELFNYDSLSVSIEKNVSLIYRDDIYDFKIEISDNYFAVQKLSTKIINFLKTADLFFDFFVSLYQKISQYIEGISQNIIFLPYFCSYQFQINLENFKYTTKSKDTVKNYELMERLIPTLSEHNSPIGSIDFTNRGRTDIKLSGLIRKENIDWTTWINIEAPGNENYSTMQMNFEFQSRVNTLPDGTRNPFNHDSIGAWRIAINPLLKNEVINKFLKEWLNDIKVKSVR